MKYFTERGVTGKNREMLFLLWTDLTSWTFFVVVVSYQSSITFLMVAITCTAGHTTETGREKASCHPESGSPVVHISPFTVN